MFKLRSLKSLKTIEIIIVVAILGAIIYGVFTLQKSEGFEDEIDKNEKEYDDALEKRIAEAKDTVRYDAEVLISDNKPYQQDKNDRKGWWSEAISSSIIPTIYSREKSTWVWPY